MSGFQPQFTPARLRVLDSRAAQTPATRKILRGRGARRRSTAHPSEEGWIGSVCILHCSAVGQQHLEPSSTSGLTPDLMYSSKLVLLHKIESSRSRPRRSFVGRGWLPVSEPLLLCGVKRKSAKSAKITGCRGLTDSEPLRTVGSVLPTTAGIGQAKSN